MKKIFVFAAILVFGILSIGHARIINVPADYATIQTGIDASSNGDTVLIHPGTYYENIANNGHNIVLGSFYLIDGDTVHISDTIIDGNSSGTVITIRNCGDSLSALIGITIQHGSGYYGGGLALYNSNVLIMKNIIKECRVYYYGGGIYCEGSNPVIIQNVITRCYSYY